MHVSHTLRASKDTGMATLAGPQGALQCHRLSVSRWTIQAWTMPIYVAAMRLAMCAQSRQSRAVPGSGKPRRCLSGAHAAGRKVRVL